MGNALASLIAIAGTLLGASATYVFQLRTARQARRHAWDERLWQERLATYSAFADALTSYRYSQNDRWHRHKEDPDGPADVAARDVSFARRASANSALFRLQLVTADPALNHLAAQALDAAWRIYSSADQTELDAGRDQALIALQEFMNAASQQVLNAAARGQAQRASLHPSP
ncbi:hypothetical protein [Nonomuraea rhodomycinica]|uniref:Protein kilB n=1 Tax=Nonomuraea rhodomycinica TaxID=1712872 RepID=A0A7Y6MEA0_9ACTN|nr:hypothetical protein [Nonomuraea rhodomycinica]NUW45378.1 hypothetical protein [Nonomuraea rhodomycinica]